MSNATGRPALIVTSGEPAGIGPDLCLRLAERDWPADLIVAADREMLAERARQLGLELRLLPASAPAEAGALRVLHLPCAVAVGTGELDRRNAEYVLAQLGRAARGCLEGEFAGMVTAPVHKGVINDAGIAFSGHTEFLAAACGGAQPVMLLTADSLRVALATTHLPLREVSDAIDGALLTRVLTVLDRDLRDRFGIPAPKIAVCGLNPHAGEGGHLGREELDCIEPALARLRDSGLRLLGPLPADTVFTPRVLDGVDAVLAMYHDQGLPVLKYAGFGSAVNVTLGLPIVRTSVDHGTALDLAGTGRAEPGSLFAAVTLAARLALSPDRR